MKTFHCPVCGKPLTEREYEDALGILGEREKHLKHEKAELLGKLKLARAKAKKAREEGRDEGVKSERDRTKRLLSGKEAEIQRLKDRVRQLQRGSTPQTEGLEFEDKLAKALRREFPGDDVKQTGRRGDVLHGVRFDKKPAGTIVYECKRVQTIPSSHIAQAFRAKQQCGADFAVLVTTGRRRGFGGLTLEHEVIVVASPGVIPLASLLRRYLIEMLRAKVTKEERAKIAARLMEYVAAPEFKNPIEEVVQRAMDLKKDLVNEMTQHAKSWRRRWDNYEVIRWSGSHIQTNVQLVLQGREPRAILRPKGPPLELPSKIRQLPPPRGEASQ